MRPFTNVDMKRGWVLLAAVLILTLAVRLGAQDSSEGLVPGLYPAHRAASISGRGATVPSALNDHFVMKRYDLDFDGDHSLDMATVIERVSNGFATYTVQLHLASGADQSVVVAAPPGGLQIEMHDMTGDKVPNDLILRPALLRWLPTVLVNDGHDHFTVAISAGDPCSISCGQELNPAGTGGHGSVGLMSSGFRTGGLRRTAQLFPQLRKNTFTVVSQLCAGNSEHQPSSGRAPPFLASSI
jgi:hypothetical protein